MSIPKLTVIIGCPEEKETPFATTQTFDAQTTKISFIEEKNGKQIEPEPV